MADFIVALIIFSILGVAIYKLIKDKRNGLKCAGCALSGGCSSKKTTTANSKDNVSQNIEIKELT